jgi:hypothetical protein
MVIFPDGDMFVAQALEVDIAAQGRSTDEACRRLRLAVNAEQVEADQAGRDMFDIGPAPASFHALYDDQNVHRDTMAA